jgi:5-hydroxyisourate hydrolase
VTTLSTHVLDSATGRPAGGMLVRLETAITIDPAMGRSWAAVGGGTTDPDGRLKSWGDDVPLGVGSYRLIFDTGAWFARLDRECFYPEVIITFTVDDDGSHYHVPLLLAAYAYSTYRGS